MKFLTTLHLLLISIIVSAQCLVPISFSLDCDNDNSDYGTITTSIGGNFYADVSLGQGTTIIEGSFFESVQWTYTSEAPWNFCNQTSGEIAPCNADINKDIVENIVDCETNSLQTSIIPSNSDIRVLDKITSSATHTNLSTNQYIAGESICLDSGFEIEKHTSFHGLIDDCTSTVNVSLECSNQQGSSWFGGDDRINSSGRNVGSGRGVVLPSNTHLESFEILLTGGFEYYSTQTPYNGDVELKLDIRDGQSSNIATTTTIVNASFSGGWVTFDLSALDLILLGDRLYIFTWYLVDGQTLQVSSGTSASVGPYVNNSFCNSFGFGATSNISNNTTLDQWNIWFSRSSLIANFRINGHR